MLLPLRQPCPPKSHKSGKRLFVTLFLTKVVPCLLTCTCFSGTRPAVVHNRNENVRIFKWCRAGGTANGCQSKLGKCLLAGSTISWLGMVYHPQHILAEKKKSKVVFS